VKPPAPKPALLAALGLAAVIGTAAVVAQGVAQGGFSLPYRRDGRLVARFSGASSETITATLHRVRGFRVETFREDETPDLTGEAPECALDMSSYNVSSPGPLTVTQAGGRFTHRGEGFSWDHRNGRLVLSNRVHTSIRLNPFASTTP